LGAGTLDGTGWRLTGLKLPSGQSFFIRARGSIRTNSGESSAESVRLVYLPDPLELVAAVSRKTHGSAGVFDVPLPLTGEPGVEPRSSGGAHTIVFLCNKEVVSGSAAVTSGAASVSGAPHIAGNTMTVSLTDAADAQKITVTLSGVTDSGGQVLPDTAVSMNMLVGDINASRVVNASDIAAVKAQSGVPVTAANFRADVAVSGGITASDVGLVKSRSGQALP
jgi:hypothetical protein